MKIPFKVFTKHSATKSDPITGPLDPLSEVGDQERLRYMVADKWDSLETGQTFNFEAIFGNACGIHEVDAFWDVLISTLVCTDPISLPSEEELNTPMYQGNGGEIRRLNRIGDYYSVILHDEENALRFYTESAERGSGYGLTRIGGYYRYEKNDINSAIEYYKKAIVADGDSNALLDLGLCYIHGQGVLKDYQKGREYMLRSAKQANPMARYNMGWFYETGDAVGVHLDWEEALMWYRLSAQDYYEQALFALCRMLGKSEETIYWSKRFADYGFPYACYFLGCCYIDGALVEKDSEKGFQMLKYAADHGVPSAARKCAECYAEGIGTAINQELSEQYMSFMMEIFHSDSDYALWERPLMIVKE